MAGGANGKKLVALYVLLSARHIHAAATATASHDASVEVVA